MSGGLVKAHKVVAIDRKPLEKSPVFREARFLLQEVRVRARLTPLDA